MPSEPARADDRSEAQACFERGLARLNEDLDQAVAEFARAIQLDPTLTEAYLHRGSASYEHGEIALAIADFTKALELQPSWQAYFERGRARAVSQQFQEAVADLSEMLSRNPDDPVRQGEAHYFRAKAYRKLGELPKALADCTRAIQLLPEHADALVERAKVYRALGDEANALSDAAHARKIREQPVEIMQGSTAEIGNTSPRKLTAPKPHAAPGAVIESVSWADLSAPVSPVSPSFSTGLTQSSDNLETAPEQNLRPRPRRKALGVVRFALLLNYIAALVLMTSVLCDVVGLVWTWLDLAAELHSVHNWMCFELAGLLMLVAAAIDAPSFLLCFAAPYSAARYLLVVATLPRLVFYSARLAPFLWMTAGIGNHVGLPVLALYVAIYCAGLYAALVLWLLYLKELAVQLNRPELEWSAGKLIRDFFRLAIIQVLLLVTMFGALWIALAVPWEQRIVIWVAYAGFLLIMARYGTVVSSGSSMWEFILYPTGVRFVIDYLGFVSGLRQAIRAGVE